MITRLEIGHKSNRMDNPTNLGVSDFSLVATTLDTNNKMSVVLKPSLIDLECLAA